jgi:hypothetical protein
MQRNYTRSRRLVLVTLARSPAMMASLWLGLNVIRFYAYAPEAKVYSTVVRLPFVVECCAAAVGILILFWAIIELASWLAKRFSIA